MLWTMKLKNIQKRKILAFFLITVGINLSAQTKVKRQTIEAEKASILNGASKVSDPGASKGYLVNLSDPGHELQFSKLEAGRKLAIRYASADVGVLNASVNGNEKEKVNIHSSGKLTGSFLYAIIDIVIPDRAKITLSLPDTTVKVNIDYIMTGQDDLGLPPDIWNLPPLPVADGPFTPDWKEMSRIYTVPQWWREAKFGVWSHWDPQSMPEQGDWYARGMYLPSNKQYQFHVNNFGHPSEYGYKDICHNWVIDKWDPESLMDLFVEMGARYFVAMGVHHDNFDCWNSAYQPWNSVNVGPKQDIVGTWEKLARSHGLRFGIGFHNTPARTWGQFMSVRYTSDKSGPKQGVPYDALQTILDGKGKWWEGLDPVDLYGPVHDRKDPLHSPFSNQFMWRIDDAISKYHPDMIYFDEHAGDSQVDLGVNMGLGFLAPSLIANYYNKSMQWNNGKMDVVINLKGIGGRYDSFQNTPELLPSVDRSLVKSSEMIIENEITPYPFQTETSIAEWHYLTGQKYMPAVKAVELLMRNVSRNGTMLLNITQHGRGDLDPELTLICKDIGAWLKVNGEAVYGSRPFETDGNDSLFYTRNNGRIYATLRSWKGEPVTLSDLGTLSATSGKIIKVELLDSDIPVNFIQDTAGLTITTERPLQARGGINDQSLASGFHVLRISHDKGWHNDDDPGATATGWMRRCNLGTGDYNNDLTYSNTPGDAFSFVFNGTGISIVAPNEEDAGKIEISIDGINKAQVDLSSKGKRSAQQLVYKLEGLTPGDHTIKIVNLGQGPVAIDALIAAK